MINRMDAVGSTRNMIGRILAVTMMNLLRRISVSSLRMTAPMRVVRTAEGRALVPALIGITRLQLVFGVVLAGALLAS